MFAFFKVFFAQEMLFSGIQNPFKFTDNVSENSLIIQMSDDYDQETANAFPALVIQESGFNEERRTLANRNTWELVQQSQRFKTVFYYRYVIHCVCQTKGEAKWLQAAAAKALMAFRNAIYETGVDDISTIQAYPPQRLNAASGSSVPGPYDCAFTFVMSLDDDWLLDRSGFFEEELITSFRVTVCAPEYNEDGELLTPSIEYEI